MPHNLKWVVNIFEFNEDFIKSYNDESDEGYFLEVDSQYPKNLHDTHNDLLFLPEKMKIEKVEKLVANLLDKEEYVIHIRNLTLKQLGVSLVPPLVVFPKMYLLERG